MAAFLEIVRMIGLIIAVILMFNLTIFVHELGHFLAARWRGVYVDRFQVWFGKPLWRKKIGEVQYGLGWIPAGGFVSLPQMVTMESVEGEVDGAKDLPPITPLDKIIVAVAGPVFSVLLAFVFAIGVWLVGKPTDRIETTQIGYVLEGSPADKAGLKAGDVIKTIDGTEVIAFSGSLRQGIVENVTLSEHPTIELTYERDGVLGTAVSEFEIPETRWWERSGMRRIGIGFAERAVVDRVVENSPAEKAGLKTGDVIESINGVQILSVLTVSDLINEAEGETMNFEVRRGEQTLQLGLTPQKPIQPEGVGYKIGVGWNSQAVVNETLVFPSPGQTVFDSLDMMWITITKVLAPGSSIKVEHLNGPVGIAKAKYDLLKTENGWRRVLWFMAFFNVNLAILNMLPIPILDGGHIVMAILEKIKGRPVNPRILGFIQTAFALLLMGFMLYVTTKDVGAFAPVPGDAKPKELVFE